MKRNAMFFAVLAFSLLGSQELNARERSQAAKSEFKRMNPCPANGKDTGPCPGYIIDHVRPLACGGADSQENMQWQTIAEAKSKDKWERKGCLK